MSVALATLNTSLTMWEDNKKLEEIRKLFAPKLSEMEFQFFIGLGKATNLNPFTREIWCVKYQDNVPAQVFIGRDGYRKAAQSHNDYDFHQCDAVYENDKFEVVNGDVKHAYTLNNRGALVGAYCIVKRHRSSRPVYVFAELKEYSTGKSLWNAQTGKPATMIKKVAESQCLRACFQDLLGGTYGEEEMARTNEKRPTLVSGSTQTERLKSILNNNVFDSETGEVISEEKSMEINNEKISLELTRKISSLMVEKEFSEERVKKAFDYYKVTTLDELTNEQAELFLSQLERAL